MAFLRTLLAGLFRRANVESEMAQELRFHIESRAADLESSGLTRGEAERRARVEFGGIDGYKESCREASGYRPLDEFRGDLRYAFRTLGRKAGFTTTAVLSLALGIGVNLSTFVSLYHVVLHPFPYPDLDRIVSITQTREKSPSDRESVTPADYLDLKRATGAFERLAAFKQWDVNLTGVDRPEHIRAALASAEFFQVLGTNPKQGRTFSAAECEPGRDAVVVVSDGFWQTRLASRPDAIGESIFLGGRKYTVIGIMPANFDLPLAAELWAPLSLTGPEKVDRGTQQLAVVGKLKPGVSVAQAGAGTASIARDLEQRYPRTNEDRGLRVDGFRDFMKTESDRFVVVLMTAAVFVLLLACMNVGSLQVARTMARERELGLRTALGARPFRILRQLLTESLVLGISGGALGLALAAWDLRISRSLIPAMVYRFVPGLRDMQIGPEVILLGIVLAVAASVLCCVPAMVQVLRQSRRRGVLDDGGRSVGASRSRSRLRTTLVIAEVAVAFVLLVGAGLMVGAFQRMLTVDLGYDPDNVLQGNISLYGSEYAKPARVAGFYETFLGNVQRVSPGIEGVAASGVMTRTASVTVEGRPQPGAAEPRPQMYSTTPQYLKVMRIPLVKGRWISEHDGPQSPAAVVLSASVVRHYWPASDPVGERVRLGGADGPWMTVVGVVGDVNDWFLGNPIPAAYVSYRQFPQGSMRVLVRTAQDPQSIAGAVRAEAQAVDRDQPLYNVSTLKQQMYEETSGVRNAARMMIMYAVIALVLAVTGIYSVTSFFVVQRTREIGVRVSLGATRQSITKMVLYQACGMCGIGLLIGLPLAVALTTAMSHAIYDAVTVQPMTFVLVMALLGTLAALAGYIPAYRAARVDPMIALRHD